MSKLDSFIRRLSTQIQCLNWASQQVCGIKGDILELGLGNGRTYDHLKLLFPKRKCFVAEVDETCIRQHSDIPRDNIILGDLRTTLPQLNPGVFALIHCDIGGWDDTESEPTMRSIDQVLVNLLVQEGILVSSLPILYSTLAECQANCYFKKRYFVYKKVQFDM